jgi:CelD/BcsL family acetyltransferase involved in cellulose biosynthesis
VVEIADTAVVRRASVRDAVATRVQTEAVSPGSPFGSEAFTPLATVPASQWRALAERANEPNGYYLPGWELAVNACARGRTGVSALSAWGDAVPAQDGTACLIGLLPAISLWRAYGIPLPALVGADPYGTLRTPVLARGMANHAAAQLLQAARKAGARALILRDITLDGAAMKAFAEVLRQGGMRPRLLQSHFRAALDATRDADQLLRDALGGKKLKELRRQRNRLAEHGPVRFDAARRPEEVASALEIFLNLEASGWKAKRGTALLQDDGDAGFVRRATQVLAESGQCEIASLHAGATPVAAAIVLRHQDRAFYFKLGIDERFAKYSPGVQLTLDLTRHLCADPAIALADSTADPDHPMIDPIWRERLAIGDVLIPLRRRDPVVSLIDTALSLRRIVREPLRRAVLAMRC